jgi:hypothetical protein
MNIDGIPKGILSQGENDSAFWNLSCGARIPANGQEVIAHLWTMRCPQGLAGQDKINPER